MDESEAAAVAAAAGTTPRDLWGVTREAFALKAAAADVGDGPATDLMTTAAHQSLNITPGQRPWTSGRRPCCAGSD